MAGMTSPGFRILVAAFSLIISIGGVTSSANAQESSYLSCRILAHQSNAELQFAGASVIWSDEEAEGLTEVPGGAQVYACSRELRAGLCRTFAGPLLNGDGIKDGAMTGAFLSGFSGSDIATGAIAGAGLSTIFGFSQSIVQTGQCLQEIDALTEISDGVSMDWTGTFTDSTELQYFTFLSILDAARQENMVSTSDVDRILSFTDRVQTLVSE